MRDTSREPIMAYDRRGLEGSILFIVTIVVVVCCFESYGYEWIHDWKRDVE